MKIFIALIVLALGSTGCTSFPARSVFESKNGPPVRVEIGAESGGRAAAQIKLAEFPEALWEGSAQKDEQGGWTISLTTLKWFNTWPNGWTDASFLVEGVLRIVKTEGWSIQLETAPSIAVADKASLRYFDTFLLGDKAVEQFSRRWERIQACAGFLASQFPDGWMNDAGRVERFLFPELRGYGTGEHPGETKMADSVAWDVTYTAKHFPENLRPVRDSGTMLRDWKESPGLWRLAYEMKPLWEHAAAVALQEKQ